MKAIALRGLTVSVVLLAASVAGAASPDLSIGPVKFHPHVELSATYDDNVFIAPEDSPREEDDFYFTLSPGLQAVYGDLDRNFISLDYTAGLVKYYDLGGQDTVNHFVTAGAQYTFDKLTLDGDHALQRTEGGDIQVGDRIQRLLNITHINAEYTLSPKTSVGLGYKQEFYDYQRRVLADYTDLSGYGRFYYKAFPKTDLFGEITIGNVDVARVKTTNVTHSASASADYQQFNAGVRGKITSKITGIIKGGYEHREFANGDLGSFVAELKLKAEFTPRTTVELLASHKVNPSIVSPGNNFQAGRVQLDVRQKAWKDKLTFLAGAAFENDDYEKRFPGPGGQRREDDYWELKAGVDYDITENVLVGALYTFRRNHSSIGGISGFSFEQNIVTVRALARF